MIRLILIVSIAFALAGCGRRGEIMPADGKLEDPRIRAFRIDEERRLEQERAQYRITRSISERERGHDAGSASGPDTPATAQDPASPEDPSSPEEKPAGPPSPDAGGAPG